MDLKPTRTERKKEETQNKIITTAVMLFNREGLGAVTMEQIAEEVDIAKGTLYNYFPSKDAIISAFLQHTFQERQAERVKQLRALPDTRARLTLVFTQLVEGVQRQKDIFEAFMLYRMRQALSFQPVEGEASGLSALVHEVIRLGQEGGDLRTDWPEDLLTGLFEYAIIAAVRPYYLEPQSYNARESIARGVDLFLNGTHAFHTSSTE
jgi:AcrR family transcriptional regulator